MTDKTTRKQIDDILFPALAEIQAILNKLPDDEHSAQALGMAVGLFSALLPPIIYKQSDDVDECRRVVEDVVHKIVVGTLDRMEDFNVSST